MMDSCNSGSMQSSSCGDEEYDSRADQSNISAAFLNNNPPLVTPFSNNPSSHMLDPLSNFLDSMQKSPSHYPNQNQNPFLNLDMAWSKPAARSEPNQPDLGSFMQNQPSSSSSQHNQAFLFSQLMSQSQTRGLNLSVAADVASVLHTTQTHNQETASASRANDQAVRNPKKRSRASRRAPTTVLTTDTTNFRAMVQEFTGIPAPPFTSSPFPRTRFDLFGSSAIRSSATSSSSHNLDHPPYLLRPFAHKIVQPQPPHSFSPSTSSFQTMVNNNQILGFQSGPSHQKYPDLGMNCSKTQSSLEITPSTVDKHVFEELGLSHHVGNSNSNIGVLQHNMVQTSSDIGALSRHNNNNMRNSSAEWAQRNSTVVGDNDGGGILGSLGGTTANYRSDIQERHSASTSELIKGPECAVAVTRGEGTVVESWINCSSD